MVVRVVIVAIAATLFGAIVGALAATNNVPASNAGQAPLSFSVQDLAPPQCAGMGLTALVLGTGATINGTAANELILGTSGSERINGNGGRDCMVGGNSGPTRDRFFGGAGGDVCIGDGTNTDSYNSCATIVNR